MGFTQRYVDTYNRVVVSPTFKEEAFCVVRV